MLTRGWRWSVARVGMYGHWPWTLGKSWHKWMYVGAAVLSTPLIDIDGCVTVADFAGGLWHFGPQLLGANSHVAGKL